jgi:hypothetical protein
MPLANWLDDFVKDFLHYVANASFECFVFLREVTFSTASIDSSIWPLMLRNT